LALWFLNGLQGNRFCPMISFCIPTARASFGLYWYLPKRTHLFQPFVESLYPQLTEPVELVISDNLTDHRDLAKFFKPYPLIQVRVVQQDNWWMRHGYPSFSQVWNEAVRHSQGDYLVILSDCLSVPDGFMRRLIRKQAEGKIAQILYHDQDADDVRWTHLNWGSSSTLTGFDKIPWQQCYGFFSMPRDWFYRLNGFDENFEGQKELNDIEMFSRLEMLDSTAPIHFDKELFVYHHGHHAVLNRQHSMARFPDPIRSNYDLIHLHRREKVTKANSIVFDRETLVDVVNAKIENVELLLEQAKGRWERSSYVIEHWISNQPVFEL